MVRRAPAPRVRPQPAHAAPPRGRRPRPVDDRHRRLLPGPQGRADAAGARRQDGVGQRAAPGRLAEPGHHARSSTSTCCARSPRSTPSPRGPTRTSSTTRRWSCSRSTRSPTGATRRSAAGRAPARSSPGEDPRSGRWAGSAKTECGLHVAVPCRWAVVGPCPSRTSSGPAASSAAPCPRSSPTAPTPSATTTRCCSSSTASTSRTTATSVASGRRRSCRSTTRAWSGRRFPAAG